MGSRWMNEGAQVYAERERAFCFCFLEWDVMKRRKYVCFVRRWATSVACVCVLTLLQGNKQGDGVELGLVGPPHRFFVRPINYSLRG